MATDPGRAVYTVEISGPNGPEIVDFEGPAGLNDQQISQLAGSLGNAQPGQVIDTETPDVVVGQGYVPEQQEAGDWAPYVDALLAQFSPSRSIETGGEMRQDLAGFAQGSAGVLDNAAELAQGAYNQTFGRVFGESDSATRANADQGGFSGLAAELGPGSEAGRTAGEIAGTYLLTRGLGGPVRQGAGAGALLSEADTPGGFAQDVAVGAGGGFVGDRAMRVVGAALDPAIEQGARVLRQAGVRLTPGQVFPALREFEDKAISRPFIGPSLQRDRNQAFEDFARSVPTQALETARRQLPGRTIAPVPEGVTGQQAVRHTGDQLSAVYEDIVPRLRLQADQQLVADVQGVATRLAQEPMSTATRRRFENMVRDGVMSRFSGSVANGRQYQAADSYLERQIARFGRSAEPDNQMIAEALQDVRATLRNAITRQNGQLGRELEAVDEAWSMLVPAETAAAGTARGYFSPAQYRQALSRGDARVRRRGMARGEVRGQEFAEAGIDVLPQQHPNYSGTASHEAYNVGNTQFWQGLAERALYGPTTRNALMAATVDRPAVLEPFAQAVAQALRPLPAPQLGAAAALPGFNALIGN